MRAITNSLYVALVGVMCALGCSESSDDAATRHANEDPGSGASPSTGGAPTAGSGGSERDESGTGGMFQGPSGGDAGAGGNLPGTSGSSGGEQPPGPGTSACDPEAIVVDSLAELLPYLDDDQVSIALAPGTYHIDNDVAFELFPTTPLFEVTGSDSTFCFTGVVIEFETEIFQSFGNTNVTELYVGGSNNVLKNLTMVDLGNQRPTRTALAIQDNGSGNLIEGFHLTIRGSEPYGYGDIFGKGSGYVIKHFKHSGILLTGDDVHLKNITMIHRSYGHGIFMQGAVGVLIEGVYMEGELSTTDAVLAEEGTSAAAVDFQPVWGGTLKPGYRFSLQEDGIRAYRNSANGRIASDITIRDSTVKFMRSGVTIGLGEGPQFVENVKVLGNESGFWVGGGGGEVVNCSGDASVGPLFSEGNPKNGNNIELTLLDSVVPKLGNTPAIYLAGNNHDLMLKDGTTSFDPTLELFVGGPRNSYRADVEPTAASNMTFDNQTPYPVILGDNSSGNEVTSCGPVTDNGTNNDITELSCQ